MTFEERARSLIARCTGEDSSNLTDTDVAELTNILATHYGKTSAMPVKIFEIRDRATFIPALAIRLVAPDGRERFLCRRAGYSKIALQPDSSEPYVILIKLTDAQAEYDSYSWGNRRTMGEAHRYIIEHWEELQTGQVVDVQFILGETEQPVPSEEVTGGSFLDD